MMNKSKKLLIFMIVILCVFHWGSQDSYGADKFVIEKGILTSYNGNDEKVIIPKGVKEIAYGVFQSRPEIKEIHIPDGLKKISPYVFYSNQNLEKVNIPNSVDFIGDWAFAACPNLKEITIGNDVSALDEFTFAYSGFEKIIFGDKVSQIDPFAFYGCKNLQEFEVSEKNIKYSTLDGALTNKMKNELLIYPQGKYLRSYLLPDQIDTFGTMAFVNSESLYEFIVPEGNNKFTVVDGVLFTKDMTRLVKYPRARYDSNYDVPKGVLSIEKGAFAHSNLRTIKLPKSLLMIGDMAFYYARLNEIEIPDNVLSIGDKSFYRSTIIKAVIGDGVKTIGEEAFYDCNNMTSIKLGKSIKKVEAGAFNACAKVNTINLPDGLEVIGSFAFKSLNIESLIIPDSVVEVGEFAFQNNYNLKKVKMGSGLKKLNLGLFYYCNSLTEISLPEYLEEIGPSVFHRSNIKEVDLPETVTTIGDQAFFYSYNMDRIYIPKTVVNIGEVPLHGAADPDASVSIVVPLKNLTVECDKNSKIYRYVKKEGIKYKIIR